nr:metal-dependent transcriptional regulator [Lachnospiraceae bacterium]
QLKENGYVDIDSEKHITLTSLGREIAETMYERHQFLTDLFIRIGVSEETAAKDACRVEHYVSEETFKAMKEHFAKA